VYRKRNKLLLDHFFRRIFSEKKITPRNRVIIVHNHLFKNAGSTIDWSLRRNFGKDFVDHRDDGNMRRGADYLGPYLAEHPAVKALSTHHLVLPLPVLNKTRLLMMLMLRHPIERVQSVYNFERKQKHASTPGAIHARKYSLSEYVEWRMRPDIGATIRNYHTIRCMYGHEYTYKNGIAEKEFARAVATIQSTEMIGLVERFDESIVLFEEYLRPDFPEIDLSYRIQNVGPSKDVPREERIDNLKKEIGEAVFAKLLDNNRWDLQLYTIACREFAARVEKISEFSQKMTSFRARCQKLRS
jgi:hypothetical protein